MRPPAWCRISGQSLVETTIALTILVMIIFGLIHISMLAVTRHVCNFAAFSAARAAVYNGMGDMPRAQEAARSITGMLPSGTQFLFAWPTRDAFRVRVNSPFGYPLTGPGGRVIVAAEAPMYAQPNIPEVGDNASR